MAKNKLEKFLENNQPRESILTPYAEDIFILKNKKFSDKQICEYLKSVGVITSRQNLNQWISRQKSIVKKEVLSANEDKTIKKQNSTESQDDSVEKLLNWGARKT